MNPVDWAGPVSEISRYLQILCKIFYVFIREGSLARLPRSRFFQPGSPFNCSDTAKRVAKAMIGVKVITRLRFAICVLFF